MKKILKKLFLCSFLFLLIIVGGKAYAKTIRMVYLSENTYAEYTHYAGLDDKYRSVVSIRGLDRIRGQYPVNIQLIFNVQGDITVVQASSRNPYDETRITEQTVKDRWNNKEKTTVHYDYSLGDPNNPYIIMDKDNSMEL